MSPPKGNKNRLGKPHSDAAKKKLKIAAKRYHKRVREALAALTAREAGTTT